MGCACTNSLTLFLAIDRIAALTINGASKMNADTYATYSDKRLTDTRAYWMGVSRAAKSPEQRARADRGAAIVATEMRKRAATKR